MPNDQPIACSLSATELPQRLAEMAALGHAALIETSRAGSQAELRFAPGATVRQRLEGIVANEARCCPFLTMTVSEKPDAITLHLAAPDGAEKAVSEITEAFGGATRTAA